MRQTQSSPNPCRPTMEKCSPAAEVPGSETALDRVELSAVDPDRMDSKKIREQRKGKSRKSDKMPNKTRSVGCLQRAATKIAEGLETLFYNLGFAIAKRPYTVILCCFLLSALSGLGMIRFTIKDLAQPIWIPIDSPVLINKERVETNFPVKYRYNSLILEASNILTPEALQGMLEIDLAVKSISNTSTKIEAHNYNWTSLCLRQGGMCVSHSLLALWKFNSTVIKGLSYEDILNTVNTPGMRDTATRFLKSVEEDGRGRIVGAQYAKMIYVIEATKALPLENKIEAPELYWEKHFIDYVLTNTSRISALEKVYVNAVRSYRDQSDKSFDADVVLLIAGVGIIICYVAIVLGKFNEVEHKVYLALIGVFGIGLASLVAYGLASAVGLFYGPIHPILPFLLLGLGVDDMFVIVEAWNNLTPSQRRLDIPEKIATALKHSGVSITVTSFTDFVAFGIGASTKLPALQSFCGYAALGIFSLFIMQSTFFVAWLAVDVRRQENHQDACCRFIKYRDFKPNRCSQRQFLSWFLRRVYSRWLIYLPIKVLVFVLAFGLILIGSYGLYNLETNAELSKFLPANSYLTQYVDVQKEFYPEDGQLASIYIIGEVNYHDKQEEMGRLHDSMYNSKYILNETIVSWHTAFNTWLGPGNFPQTAASYYKALYRFYRLSGDMGYPYYGNIKWNDTTDPGNLDKPRRVNASQIPFTVPTLLDTAAQIDALTALEDLGKDQSALIVQPVTHSDTLTPTTETKTTSQSAEWYVFPWAIVFENWETSRVIKGELYTNMGLAFLAVLVVTLCLVADIWMCVLVCLNVVITLVEVCGFMKLWGIDIDTLTSILLILSVGLAVDFSAHVAHTFMTVAGSKNERAIQTINLIGPAIINGGFSTLLAFILLANSDSYIFTTFFKVFFLVVIFGLFNGLALLPILLSWVGPKPYLNAHTVRLSSSMGILKSPHLPRIDTAERRLRLDTLNSQYSFQHEGDEEFHRESDVVLSDDEERITPEDGDEGFVSPPDSQQQSIRSSAALRDQEAALHRLEAASRKIEDSLSKTACRESLDTREHLTSTPIPAESRVARCCETECSSSQCRSVPSGDGMPSLRYESSTANPTRSQKVTTSAMATQTPSSLWDSDHSDRPSGVPIIASTARADASERVHSAPLTGVANAYTDAVIENTTGSHDYVDPDYDLGEYRESSPAGLLAEAVPMATVGNSPVSCNCHCERTTPENGKKLEDSVTGSQ